MSFFSLVNGCIKDLPNYLNILVNGIIRDAKVIFPFQLQLSNKAFQNTSLSCHEKGSDIISDDQNENFPIIMPH